MLMEAMEEHDIDILPLLPEQRIVLTLIKTILKVSSLVI